MIELASAFMLGMAGSAHCTVMCGPLTLVLRGGMKRGAWSFGALYHAARVSSYGLIGVAAGLAGRAFTTGGVGRVASVALGVLLVVAAAMQMASRALPALPGVGLRVARAIATVHRHRQDSPISTALAAGALNALLPCGLVYLAAAAAAGLGSVLHGASFMLMFGAGTLPALAAIWTSAATVPHVWRARLRYAAPIAVAVVGLLLIVRGAEIPVVSMNPMGHMHGQ